MAEYDEKNATQPRFKVGDRITNGNPEGEGVILHVGPTAYFVDWEPGGDYSIEIDWCDKYFEPVGDAVRSYVFATPEGAVRLLLWPDGSVSWEAQ